MNEQRFEKVAMKMRYIIIIINVKYKITYILWTTAVKINLNRYSPSLITHITFKHLLSDILHVHHDVRVCNVWNSAYAFGCITVHVAVFGGDIYIDFYNFNYMFTTCVTLSVSIYSNTAFLCQLCIPVYDNSHCLTLLFAK